MREVFMVGLMIKKSSWHRIVAVVGGISLGAWAMAIDSKPAATRPAVSATQQVDGAIKTLSSDNWKARQAAQDALVALGEEAIPRLRQLSDKADDEEVRTRCAAALHQIEENSLVGPSAVTLHVKDAKPQEVFDQLAKQSHCEFPTWPRNLWQQTMNNGAAITMDYDKANFWVVFKEACQKGGVFPQQIGNDRRMTLQQGSNTYWNGPSVTSGPFLIVANRLYRSNSVDLANPGNVQHEFSMGLSAFCEPKVKVVQSSYNVQVDEAVDDKGNSLLNPNRMYDGFSNGQQWMWNLTASLNYPENAGKFIKRFKGSVKFMIQTKSETLDIPDVLNAKNVQKTVAHRRILLKEVKKNGEQYDVQITLYRDGMSQQDWNSMQNPGYTVRLLDKEGRSLSAGSWGGGGGGDEMTYTWNFNRNTWGGEEGKVGDPQRLVWEIPLEMRESTVSFEFKDLPLP
jgi:hypothetical protein